MAFVVDRLICLSNRLYLAVWMREGRGWQRLADVIASVQDRLVWVEGRVHGVDNPKLTPRSAGRRAGLEDES